MSDLTTKKFFERLVDLLESEQPMATSLKQISKEFAGSPFEHFAIEVYGDVFEKGLSMTQRMSAYPELFSSVQVDFVAEAERSGELVTFLKKAAEANS